MADRFRVLLTVALLATLMMPLTARAAEEPVATAPIPPPLPSATPPLHAVSPLAPISVPHKPLAATSPKTSAAKPATASTRKKPVSVARAHAPKPVAVRHTPHHQPPHLLARLHNPYPVPERRYYAGVPTVESDAAAPPPPPWYGYYPGPWRRGPAPPW